MPWRDNLLPASFRGVEFGVDEHESQIAGRRAQTHEYPGRDVPFTEDLGRRTKRYDVEAYIVGEDYFARRDELLDACDMAGPGELVHPYLGSVSVVCRACNLRESTREGRMCRLTLEFVESGENIHPTDRADSAAVVMERATVARMSVVIQFTNLFGL